MISHNDVKNLSGGQDTLTFDPTVFPIPHWGSEDVLPLLSDQKLLNGIRVQYGERKRSQLT